MWEVCVSMVMMKLRKVFWFSVMGLFLIAIFPIETLAATRGAVVVPKLRSDHLAVTVNFSGLDNIESIAYCLTYISNGRRQGACGSITPAGQTNVSRELLLGTCSRNVCTFFPNVKNLRLAVRSKLKVGSPKYVTRSFRFRI